MKNGELDKIEGTHLMIDGYNCNKYNLGDKNRIESFLRELVAELGMNLVHDPVLVDYAGNGSWDAGGVTGFVLIAESHISIHTFAEQGVFSADVYSCKKFDPKPVEDKIKKFFESDSAESKVQERILYFKKNWGD